MTDPLPNCFSICPSAAVSAFLRFSSMAAVLSIGVVLPSAAAVSGILNYPTMGAPARVQKGRGSPQIHAQRPRRKPRVAARREAACRFRLKLLTLRQIEVARRQPQGR